MQEFEALAAKDAVGCCSETEHNSCQVFYQRVGWTGWKILVNERINESRCPRRRRIWNVDFARKTKELGKLIKALWGIMKLLLVERRRQTTTTTATETATRKTSAEPSRVDGDQGAKIRVTMFDLAHICRWCWGFDRWWWYSSHLHLLTITRKGTWIQSFFARQHSNSSSISLPLSLSTGSAPANKSAEAVSQSIE